MNIDHDWPINEGSGSTVTDTVSGQDGTLSGGSWTSDSTARDGTAIACGGNAEIDVGHASSFNYSGSYTLYSEFRYSTSSSYQIILAKGQPLTSGGSSAQYALWVHQDDTISSDHYTDGGSTRNWLEGSALSGGTYYYVAMRYDASTSTVSLWVNGSQVDSQSAGAVNTNSQPLAFAYDQSRSNYYFNGDLGSTALIAEAPSDSDMQTLTNDGIEAFDSDSGGDTGGTTSSEATIGGDNVTGITFGGDEIVEVTMDADVVWAIGTVPGNPTAYWPIDEGSGSTAIDDAGTYDGSISGATWTSHSSATGGTALSFDGTDDGVTVPHDTALNPTNSYTIYLEFEVADPTTTQVLMSKGGTFGGGSSNDSFGIGTYQGDLFIDHYAGDGTSRNNIRHPISANTFYQMALAYDGSTIELWLDGSSVTSKSANSMNDTTHDLSIGYEAYRSQYYTNGTIGAAGLWQERLSDSDLTDLTT